MDLKQSVLEYSTPSLREIFIPAPRASALGLSPRVIMRSTHSGVRPRGIEPPLPACNPKCVTTWTTRPPGFILQEHMRLMWQNLVSPSMMACCLLYFAYAYLQYYCQICSQVGWNTYVQSFHFEENLQLYHFLQPLQLVSPETEGYDIIWYTVVQVCFACASWSI